MDGQDIIVIGASAGGIVALRALVQQLPSTLQATLFVVVHTTPFSPGLLWSVLNSAGTLPVSNAVDNKQFLPGHIYVAPPNYHLLIEQERMRVVQGARENHVRPSIDVLFRSAAIAYGKRVTGILLSGLLDDGVAGLVVIKNFGGRTIVQEPSEAQFKDMPLNALHRDKVDLHLTVTQIAKLIADPDHVAKPSMKDCPEIEARRQRAVIENMIAGRGWAEEQLLDALGQPSKFTCPECQSTLWQIQDGLLPRFRCRNGHAFTVRTLLQAQEAVKEDELWQAASALEEIVSLNSWMAEQQSATGKEDDFDAQAKQAREQLEELHRMLDACRYRK